MKDTGVYLDQYAFRDDRHWLSGRWPTKQVMLDYLMKRAGLKREMFKIIKVTRIVK